LLSEEELRQYFLFLKNIKHYSHSTSTIGTLILNTFGSVDYEASNLEPISLNLLRPFARLSSIPILTEEALDEAPCVTRYLFC